MSSGPSWMHYGLTRENVYHEYERHETKLEGWVGERKDTKSSPRYGLWAWVKL